MNFHLIDACFVLLIVILVWQIKWIKPFNAINKDYLSIKSCNAMRGLFALVPLLVHVADCVTYNGFSDWFTRLNAVVAGFFFFAGFGLMKSHINKPGYHKGFLLKRLPKILIPYVAMIVLYWLGNAFFYGYMYPIKDVANSYATGVPFVTFSWFIVHILVFYVLFWLLMVICKKHYLLMIIGALVYFVLSTWFVVSRGFGVFWYESTLAIPIGMFWALYEEKIYDFMSKYYWIVTAIVFAITIYVYYCGTGVLQKLFSDRLSLNSIAVTILMMLCIILGMMKFAVGNPISRFLGDISLEIYLLHGFMLMAFRNNRIYIESDALFTFAVIASTIVASVIMHNFFEFLFKKMYSRG